jgi:hypothetical protein
MEWPKPNEKLLRLDVDWQHNACIDCYAPSLGNYATKFKEAADVLVREAAAGNAVLDQMIIPIVFLYRQYIELSLKEIIMFGREVVGTGTGYPANSHDLKELWKETLSLLTAHYGADIPSEAGNVTSCIEDIHAHDPKSFSFRYPTDKTGKPSLSGIQHINIRNLYETMDRLASFLDCMSIDLGRAYDYVTEHRGD